MKTYHHSKNAHQQFRRLKWLHALFVIFCLLSAVAAVASAVYLQRESNKAQAPAVSAEYRETFSGTAQKTVESGTFTFRTRHDWKIAADESDIPKKYVYYSTRNDLIEHRFTVFLDEAPPPKPVKRILPVTVNSSGQMVTEAVSPPCNDAAQVLTRNHTTKHNNVTFTCLAESNDDITAAGLVGGSYAITVHSSRGEHKAVFILEGLTMTSGHESLSEILNTFKLK